MPESLTPTPPEGMDGARLSELIHNLHEVVFRTNAEGRWTFLNPAWTELSGSPIAQSLGQPMADSLSEGNRTLVTELFGELRSRRRDYFNHDLLFHRRDGSKRWVECFARVELDREGTVVGMMGTLVDITERKQLERLLREARAEAESASRAKSDFLAVISHELRTPMNGILGFAHLLLETELNEDQREMASVVRSSGQALLTLLNDILDFSKLESGDCTFNFQPFPASEAVQRVIRLLFSKAGEKNLSLQSQMDIGPEDLVTGDPGRTQQVLVNLIGNAIKFTPSGTIQIRAYRSSTVGISTIQDNLALSPPPPPVSPSQQNCICVVIQDPGIGIEVEKQGSLFEKFTQADCSTTRRHGGAGIGLALAKNLVHRMNGLIGVTSRPGEGSSFWFTLPCPVPVPEQGFVSSDSAARASVGLPSETRLAPQPQEARRILVAEDNITNAQLVRRLLERMGYTADVVSNGQVAIEQWLEVPYALIVMDCDMPALDGWTAARKIRELEASHRRPHTPIIALTASAMSGDRDRCFGAGMDDYLAKPVSVEALRQVVGRWINDSTPTSGEAPLVAP